MRWTRPVVENSLDAELGPIEERARRSRSPLGQDVERLAAMCRRLVHERDEALVAAAAVRSEARADDHALIFPLSADRQEAHRQLVGFAALAERGGDFRLAGHLYTVAASYGCSSECQRGARRCAAIAVWELEPAPT